MYIGLILGFITSSVLIPKYFDPDVYGTVLWFIDTAVLFTILSNIGLPRTTIRFMPYFRDKSLGIKGLLKFLMTVSTLGVFVASLIIIGFEQQIKDIFKSDDSYYVDKLYWILPIVLLFASYKAVLSAYLSSLMRPRITSLFGDVIERLFVLFLLLLFIFKVIDVEQFILLYVLKLLVTVTGLIVFLQWIGQFKIRERPNFLKTDLFRDIKRFSLYSIFADSSAVIISRIDRFMVAAMVSFTGSGIYAPFYFLSNVVSLPHRGIGKIAQPMIAQSWKENDIEKLNALYKRTMTNNLVVGMLLFIGIWINIDHFITILGPEKYSTGKYVALFVGIAQLVHVINGYVGMVLINSPKYRFDFISKGIATAITIITNLIFIPIYGFLGAAIATAITLIISNLINQIFVYYHFRLHPFSGKVLGILAIGGIAMAGGLLLPLLSSNWILDLIYQSAIVTILYAVLIWSFNLAPDITKAIQDLVRKTLKFKQS